MTLTISGISHHTSPLELREQMAFSEEVLPQSMQRLKRLFPEGGAVILSTCNRVEVYVRSERPAMETFQQVRQFLSSQHGIPEDTFSNHLYEYEDREAIRHLFKVASSLDSLVVGEDQILGQVHHAYLVAQSEDTTDKILRASFQRAFKVAKEVRTRTNIGTGKVSVSSIAVDLAVSIFMNLADKTVLIIGSGDTGELALRSLVERGAGKVMVANRTLANAQELASQYAGDALSLDDLQSTLHAADIIISSTASKEPILQVEHFQAALKQRDRAPMLVIDIAVPRDIEAQVNQLDNVYLYDMDDLKQVAESNLEARLAEFDRCLEIIDHHVDQFIIWRQSLHAEPTIVSMTQEFNMIRERELEKTLAMFPDLSDAERQEVEYLTRRIVGGILQRPMTQIKQEVIRDDPNTVLRLVKRLFGLEDPS